MGFFLLLKMIRGTIKVKLYRADLTWRMEPVLIQIIEHEAQLKKRLPSLLSFMQKIHVTYLALT